MGEQGTGRALFGYLSPCIPRAQNLKANGVLPRSSAFPEVSGGCKVSTLHLNCLSGDWYHPEALWIPELGHNLKYYQRAINCFTHVESARLLQVLQTRNKDIQKRYLCPTLALGALRQSRPGNRTFSGISSWEKAEAQCQSEEELAFPQEISHFR